MLKKSMFAFLIFLLCFNCSTNVYAYTVDDVRDLLGQERVDDTFTEAEIATIVEQYEKIEKANLYLKLFEIGKEIDINSDLEKKYQELEEKLLVAHENLALSFQGGKSISNVLKDKSKLESLLYEISSLRDIGYDIEVEYIPNIWEEKYKKVQNMVATLNEQYDIGDVGEGMKSPAYNSFSILSPYGFRLNENKDSLIMHNGIDIIVPIGTMVISQWNGIVSKIYESETMGKTIEISHGNNLKTVYSNLSEIKVAVGQRVKQYDVIALSGDTGKVNQGQLHFTVYLDGETINPIYLYGSMGLHAFQTFVSENPERYLEVFEIEKLIKEKPSKEVEKEENSAESPSTGLILDTDAELSVFNKKMFYENLYGSTDNEENKENVEESIETEEEREKRKQEALEKLLNS